MSEENLNNNVQESAAEKKVIDRNFITYPRQFVTFKWHKPILVGLIMLVLSVIFQAIITVVAGLIAGVNGGGWEGFMDFLRKMTGGYDTFEVYTVPGVLSSVGSVAAMLLALWIAVKIVKDRPFSSYASSRGGWNWGIYFRCIGVALATGGIPIVVSNLLTIGDRVNRFTVLSFVLLTIIGPLQCIAEEYLFRGLLLQTVGAWTGNAVIGAVLATAVFGASHPYNILGVIEVCIDSLIWCFIAHRTRGIEATSAMHVVNNMLIFYMTGLGLNTISSQTQLIDVILSTLAGVLYMIAIIFIDKKYHWFDVVTRDDVTPFNEAAEARMAAKAAK